MNLIAPQERRMSRNQAADDGSAGSGHEIKYRQDAANYVSAMLAELRQIASKAGFDKLVTALDAAYYEAYGAVDAKQKSLAAEAGEKSSNSVEPEAS